MTSRRTTAMDKALDFLFGDNNPSDQDVLVEELQNQVEDQGFILADRQELVDALQSINKNLVARNQDLQTTKETLQQDRDAAVARSTSLQSDVHLLNFRIEEMQAEQASRRDRLAELQAEYNEYVKESGNVINRYAFNAQAEKDRAQAEHKSAEHLAKQAIRLQQENEKLKGEVKEGEEAIKENQTLRNLVLVTYTKGLCGIVNLAPFFFGLRTAKKMAQQMLDTARETLDRNGIKLL